MRREFLGVWSESDYPGIRQGGSPNSVIRDIEMRDMVAVSILLAGFTLSDRPNQRRYYLPRIAVT